MKTFLKPLTSDEESLYLQKYQTGDLEARNILIERNLRLVAHIAKKYQNQNVEMEDLISIGTIGLIKAITTFKADRGSRLATYAARCIDNELLMLFRSRKKSSREISLYEPIGNDTEGNEIHLIDLLESEEPDVIEQLSLVENSKKLYEYFQSVLSPREQKILCMRYGIMNQKECTQKEIAAQMGISRSYVSRIEKKALEKLLHCFQQEESV